MNDILKRIDGESEKECLYRIGEAKNNGLLDMTWQQVADWMNAEWRESETEYRTESAYRKLYRSYADAHKMFEKKQAESNGEVDEHAIKIRELEKERIRLSTEKLEYARWLREDARDELICEKICDAIKTLPSVEIPDTIGPMFKNNDKAAILLLADSHYGCELNIKGLYGEVLNEYNPEIYEKRMWDLFNQVVYIIGKEGFADLNVYELGDSIDGLLRVSQIMRLRYGVIESTVRYARFLTEWLNELTKYVRVKFQMVKQSNHNQLRLLDGKKNTFVDEDMSLLIAEKFMDRLGDNPNFEFIQNPTGYVFDNILEYNVLGIHGECKDLSQTIKDFSRTYKTQIDFLVGGHKHHSANEAVGIESDVISAPSIIGIDDYSLSLHKTSNAGATLFVLEKGRGKTMEYNIKL